VRRRWTFGGKAGLVAAVLLLATVLSGCVNNAPQDALKPQGPESRVTYHLFVPVFWIAVAVFIIVESLIVYCVVRFRARDDEESPVQIHGSRSLETAWTIIPALLLGTIGIFTIKTVFEINRIPKGPDVLHVQVIGHRWWWEFRYPDANVVTANDMYIPTGTKVVLSMTSADVIHSFWPPALAGKVDVVPGQINQMIVDADHAGEYFGQCAEYCGTSHANMRLRVKAVSPSEFDTWIKQQQAPPANPGVAGPQNNAAVGANLFLTKGCAGCHTINGVSAGTVGPNLTHLQSRDTFAGAIYDLNDTNLRMWLRDPPAAKPGSVMPDLHLSEAEITSLIAYLDTLK
jgi:cytochrome c oxidase subunit 2